MGVTKLFFRETIFSNRNSGPKKNEVRIIPNKVIKTIEIIIGGIFAKILDLNLNFSLVLNNIRCPIKIIKTAKAKPVNVELNKLIRLYFPEDKVIRLNVDKI